MIVIFKDAPQKFILSVMNGFQGIFTVSCIVEEGTAFTLTGERCHGAHLSHHEGGHKFVRSDAVDILFVVYFENFSDVIESVGSVVGKRIDSGVIVLIPKLSGYEFKVVFESKVLGLFADDFLKSFDASDCHLNSYHHVKDEIPVLISYKDHVSFCIFNAFVNIFGRIFLFVAFKLCFFFKFLANVLIDGLCLLHHLLYFLFNKLQLFLEACNLAIFVVFFNVYFVFLDQKIG